MSRTSIVWALVLVGAVTVARESRAQDCGTLPENAVVVAGSSAIQPLIKASAGPLLMSAGIDVYYANVGSCTGSKDLFVHGGAVTATVSHYDATGQNPPNVVKSRNRAFWARSRAYSRGGPVAP